MKKQRGRTVRRRFAVTALIAASVFAVVFTTVASAPAERGAQSAKHKGKKHKKKKRGKQQPAAAATSPTSELTRAVFVGNNWDGTADILTFDPPPGGGAPGEFRRVARLNIIPDRDERMQEIALAPDKLAFYLAIRQAVGEGNDQFVDDMYSSNDGKLLVVSRPSFADVIGMDIASGQIVWRFPMTGYRADHMAVSPDGKNVAVSDSTGNVVHILDVATGQEVGMFPSGDSPHENNYSQDGSLIYHASIGRVYTPTDNPEFDTSKGDARFQIVDAATNQIVTGPIYMKDKFAEVGRDGMSNAVRPMALSPDESRMYFQVSFFHGFAEYDFAQNKITRIADLPNEVPNLPREQYLLDSAHHGIAINDSGTTLCAAGTMSDYVAMVSEKDFTDYDILHLGHKPYWSTTSDDGENCFVSWSGDDAISAISYRTRQEVARIDVGDHPQRVRTGVVRTDWAASQPGG